MRCFKYSNRPKSYITVTQIDDPYGDSTGPVVSIGCTLKGDTQNPTWKVHVPIDLAEGVAQEMMRLCGIARKSRQTSTRSAASISFDENGNIICDTTTVTEAPVDIEAASQNAVTLGRVIKRGR